MKFIFCWVYYFTRYQITH